MSGFLGLLRNDILRWKSPSKLTCFVQTGIEIWDLNGNTTLSATSGKQIDTRHIEEIIPMPESNLLKTNLNNNDHLTQFCLTNLASDRQVHQCTPSVSIYNTNKFRKMTIQNVLSSKNSSVNLPKLTSVPDTQVRTFSSFVSARNNDCFKEFRNSFLLPPRRMAGHSKWQNIRHIKGSKDLERGMIFSRLAMKIKVAVKEGGSNDVKLNSQLARAVGEAKSKDMPNATIESAIKSVSSKDGGLQLILEMRGPGSCLWIVETFTDKPKRTRMELSGLIKKHGCAIVEGNSALGAFDKKGIIEVDLPEEAVNMDDYLEIAIEVGAEDVQQQADAEDKQVLAFITDPEDLHVVRKAMDGRQLEIKNYYIDYYPRVPALVGEADLKNLQILLTKIQSHPEVVKVFENIQLAD